MRSPRENEVEQSVLSNVSQALEGERIDNSYSDILERDVPVDGIADGSRHEDRLITTT
jgi:hypothetical protein